MHTPLLISALVVVVLILFLFLYRLGKDSTITTSEETLKNKKHSSTFVGIEQETEPSPKLFNPHEIPSASEEFLNFELLADITPAQEKALLKSASSSKKAHPLLTSLTRNVTDAKELVEIIKNDPELVVKVIKVSNSALFALQKPITTINHAVVFLGVLQAKNIAMRFALERSVDFRTEEQHKAYHKLWKAGFLASTIGLLIAKDLKLENSAELSTHCLLNYLGDISLLSLKPQIANYYLDNSDFFTRVNNIQTKVKSNSAIMAKTFARHAELPTEIVDRLGASLLPLVNDLEKTDLETEAQKTVVFSYYISRIVDVIVFQRTVDFIEIEEISFAETKFESFYYAQEHITKYQLGRINGTLRKPQFKRHVYELIEKLDLDS